MNYQPTKKKRPLRKNILSLVLSIIVVSSWMISCNSVTTKNVELRTDKLDSLFSFAIQNNEIPAVAALIIHDEEIIYNKAFGWSNIEKDRILKTTDIFRIASMTKSFTAVGILQLLEQGKLSLDDPVSNYIAEFKDPVLLTGLNPDSSFTYEPAKNEITIQHLLTHTSGIGYGFQSDLYNALVVKNGISEGFEERNIETIENARLIGKLPLLHNPGSKWTYSLSFDVLGAVIEIVSETRLDDYFRENIFDPLEMKDTYFYLPDDKSKRLVRVYEYNNNKNGFIPATYESNEYPVQGAQTYMSGGADLSCTIYDMGIYAQMLLNKGSFREKRILGSQYVEMMTSKQSEHGWWNSDIGFGVSVLTKEGAIENTRSEKSFDFGGFYDTWCWVDRDKQLVGIIFLQMYPNNEYGIGSRFQDLTYKVINRK